MTDNDTFELDENPNRALDEHMDWICWCFATTGERFYPPDETAEECIEAMYTDEEPTEYAMGVERGQHSRAWTDAQELFEKMAMCGFDPKGRAQRYIDNDENLEPIEWEWWDEHKRHSAGDENG